MSKRHESKSTHPHLSPRGASDSFEPERSGPTRRSFLAGRRSGPGVESSSEAVGASAPAQEPPPRAPASPPPEPKGDEPASSPAASKVFFTKELTAAGLVGIYSRIKNPVTGKVAIKLHTGEPNGPNILPRDMVRALQGEIPNSNLVETNTFYQGKRTTTADHRETLAINGWDFCPVDIMDEDGAVMIPVEGGRRFKEMSVGKNLLNYESMVVLTHFKGHAMGGYGGSMKNIAIGCAGRPRGQEAHPRRAQRPRVRQVDNGGAPPGEHGGVGQGGGGSLRGQDSVHQRAAEHVRRLRLRRRRRGACEGPRSGDPRLHGPPGPGAGLHRHGLRPARGGAPRSEGAHRVPQGAAPARVHEDHEDGQPPLRAGHRMMSATTKACLLGFFLLAAATTACGSPKEEPAKPKEEPAKPKEAPAKPKEAPAKLVEERNSVIVYFSTSGNTKAVAERIGELTGAKIVRIETAEPYPTAL